MNKTTVNIKGMHCRSCEILIEDELLKVPGVDRVNVNHTRGCAEIYHESTLDTRKVVEAISESGYLVGRDKKPFFSRNINDYMDVAVALGIMFFVYLLADSLGVFNLVKFSSNDYSSIPVVFIIGITAGLSTCMALVGGLVLGASAKFAEKHPAATPLQKFKPHLFFNLGRIGSYFFFGASIGYMGSFFQLSPLFLGVLMVAAGVVMLLLGIQLIDISPRLRSINFTLPKSVSRAFGIKEHNNKEYSHKNSMVLGALTFFLPCGFTQAMQLYAISTGDPIQGSLTMGVFAIGTAPGLLGIGGLTSVIKGAYAKSFFKFAGIVVVALAFFNISNGYNLTGANFGSLFATNTTSALSDPNVSLENGVQVVRMTQDGSGYSPNSFTIKTGIPVRWIITSTDVNTCASSIVSSSLNVRQGLKLGENVIEFTPSEVGQINFSCIMGMYRGSFNVVDSSSPDGGSGQVPSANNQGGSGNNPPAAAAGCSAGGCGCGGGAAQKNINISVTPAVPSNEGDVQVIKMTYTKDNDIQPNKFTVKAGKAVKMEINVKDDGYGCMGSVMVPGLTQNPEILTKGKPIVFNFTPVKTGEYPITCAMGVPRGIIRVE